MTHRRVVEIDVAQIPARKHQILAADHSRGLSEIGLGDHAQARSSLLRGSSMPATTVDATAPAEPISNT